MFRDLVRKKQQLTEEECVAVLKNEKRGVLAVLGDEDYPYALPMDYFYDEEENAIYFHGSRKGHKIDSLKKNNKVSFCVYDEGFRREGEWALNIKSVISFGKISFIDNIEEISSVCRRLGYKYTSDTEYIEKEVATYSKNALCLRLEIEHMTGKIVNES